MFLEIQILALGSRFAISRAANEFSMIESDHSCFQINGENTSYTRPYELKGHSFTIRTMKSLKREGFWPVTKTLPHSERRVISVFAMTLKEYGYKIFVRIYRRSKQ